MHALFVHGMGRTQFSGYRLLRRLQKHGITTSTFFYSVTFEGFSRIESRLRNHIEKVASQGEYILIGHSLGGILIRAALAMAPPETRLPNRVFLLGSPVRPSRVARYLSRNWLFRLAAGDCGQLLSSDERMQNVAPCHVPTTSFVGTSGFYGRMSPFGSETNDGVVSESEISADWIGEDVRVPVVHSWMPSSHRIADLIVERILSEQKKEQLENAQACPAGTAPESTRNQ